jgi:Na+/H+-dicarboxylate symporter
VQGQLTSIADVITGFFPSNLVADFSDNRILPIIVATAAVAIAYVLVADKNPALTRPFKSLIDAVKLIVFKAVEWVIALTPYAVLALVVSATAGGVNRGGLAWALLGLLLVAVVALALDTWAINYVLLRAFARVRPGIFFRKIAPAQLVAFSTQSSVGTLPVTTQVLTRGIGVSEEVAGFTAPLGTTIGMPGCAGIWPILVAIFAIHGLGLTYGVGDYALLVATGLLVSLGTAGVPGTATITSASVLAALGLPLEVVLLVVPISAIADTARTASNVTAAAVAATIVAREEGALDDAVFSGTTVVGGRTIKSPSQDAPTAGRASDTPLSGVPAGAHRKDEIA